MTEAESIIREAMIQVLGDSRSTVLLASPHRYPDLARLWFRFISRDLMPAFSQRDLHLDVNIFCDANASRFDSHVFPGAVFSQAGPGMRDFMEFYDAALTRECDFLFFVDADLFLLDGEWISSYFEAFRDPTVAAVSFMPRKCSPAIFALLCRAEMYRALPAPVFACRYEHPEVWPNGTNLQPGDFAARELTKKRKRIINVDAAESSEHIAMFRSTTGIRATREHIVDVSGEQVFQTYIGCNPACIRAGYDNVLLGTLYERLFGEPFAADDSGTPLAGSMTLTEIKRALSEIRDQGELRKLREYFQQSERAISRLAAREGIQLPLPSSPSLFQTVSN